MKRLKEFLAIFFLFIPLLVAEKTLLSSNLPRCPAEARKYIPTQNSAWQIYQDILYEHRADSLLQIGKTFADRQDFPNALRFYSLALQNYLKGNNRRKISSCYFLLGDAYYLQEDFFQAASQFEQALKYLAAIDEPELKAGTYRYLGWTYFQSSQYSKALSSFENSLQIYKKLKRPAEQADCLWGEALITFNLQHFSDAIELFRSAGKFFEQDGNFFQQAKCLYYQGYCYLLLKNFQQAIPYFEQASSQLKQSDDLRLLGDCYYHWADAYYYQKNYNQARKLFLEAKSNYQTAPDSLNFARSLLSIGACYLKMDDCIQAIKWYKDAASIFEKISSPTSAATCYLMIGHCNLQLDSLQFSLENYKKARNIFAEFNDTKNEAESQKGIADCQYLMQNYEQAISSYLKTIELYKSLGNDLIVAQCYKNLSKCYFAVDDYYSAIETSDAGANRFRLFADNMEGEAKCIKIKAESLFYLKKYSESAAEYSNAAKLYHRLKDAEQEAECYQNSANAFFNDGEYDLAMDNYRLALQIYSEEANQKGIAESHLGLADLYYLLNLPEEAKAEYQQVLKMSDRVPSLQAKAYFRIAGILKEQKQYKQAIESYQKAQLQFQTLNDSSGCADCYFSIANILVYQNKYEEAQRLYKRAARIYESLQQSEDLASCFFNLGDVNIDLAHYEQARQYFNQSLNIYQKLNILDGVASCLAKKGFLFLLIKPVQSKQALHELQRALAIYQSLKQPEISGEIFCYRALGQVYAYEDQFKEAKQWYLKAAELLEKSMNPISKAYCFLDIGEMDEKLGNFSESKNRYLQAIQIFEQEKNVEGQIAAYNQLANFYFNRDQYEPALTNYLKALNESESHDFKSHSLACLINIGNIYSEVGLNDSALVYYNSGLKLARALKDTARLGACLSNLGNIYYDEGDNVKAQQHYEQAFQIAERDSESIFLISCLINLGNIHCRRQLLEQAKIYYNRALVLSKRLHYPRGQGISLNNLGSIDLDQGNYLDALNQFNRAEKIFSANYIQKVLPTLYGNIAVVYEKFGQYEKAFQFYKNAIQVIEVIRIHLKRERLLQSFIKSKAELYDRIIALLIDKLNDIESAAYYLERSKYTDLSEIYHQRAMATGDKRLMSLLKKYDELKRKMDILETELEKNRRQSPEDRDLAREKNLSKLIASTKAKADQISAQLGPEVEIKVRLLQKLQQKIPDEAIFLMYHASRNSLYIFLITNKNFHVRQVPVTREKLFALIRRYRDFINKSISISQQRGTMPSVNSWQDPSIAPLIAVSESLYSYLIAPAKNYLKGKKRLTIIPSDLIYYLPIHALARKSQSGKPVFVIQNWEVNYLTSISFLDLSASRKMASQKQNTPHVAAFANADGSLPLTEKELQTLKVFVPDAEIFEKEQATEERAIMKSKDCSVLIFATHCYLDNKNPYQTYIKLAPSEKYDGRWRVREVQNIFCPNLQFVILSACATAIGESNPGSEIRNLSESFNIAGASSILATLWPISDISSVELMTHFYRNYFSHKQSKANSLRQAQLNLLSDPRFRHPVIWAPYLLIGDWR